MIYNKGCGLYEGWILTEEKFDAEFPGKGEAIMCLGNGYMGVRAAMEEYIIEGSRVHLVAGTFNFMEGDCATELPNLPDITNMKITFDGEDVCPTGKIENFERTLNVKTGLLRRVYTWESSKGKKLELEFLRMVSLKDLHLICAKVNITAPDGGEVIIESGIDANVRHWEHLDICGVRAVSDILCMTCETKESKVRTATLTSHKVAIDGTALDDCFSVESDDERRIMAIGAFDLSAGQTLTVTKTSNVFTSRDKERTDCDMATLVEDAFAHMKAAKGAAFEEHLEISAAEWERKVWIPRDIKIKSVTDSDQLSVRFAMYHLTVMSPVHDNRMNIGAKGLSGLGYRGHTFWDTEIFMLPYFVYTNPEEAKSLIEYRYNSLDAARALAKKRGFEGAMFPWEAAWITDGETTPTWCQTGEIEIHITADVALGVYNYFIVTGDKQFMIDCGYELIFETAKFWASRLEYKADKDRYEITNVIGPNEYKENIDNNAYTNYLTQYNMQLAVKYATELKAENAELYAKLNEIVGLDALVPVWEERISKIYLPVENEDGILPENDTFLSMVDIARDDITVSEMAREAHEICAQNGGLQNCMVLKQADVMLLMYMFEDFFTAESKKKNYYFYERRCFHDSSLSLSTFAALAADLHEKETAYRMFNRASLIDMGPVMWSSVEGIHSASLGGIWQCCVFGFGGVRRYGEQLRIEPNLPDEWTSIEFAINWHGQRLEIAIDHNEMKIANVTGTEDVEFLCHGKIYKVGSELVLDYKK